MLLAEQRNDYNEHITRIQTEIMDIILIASIYSGFIVYLANQEEVSNHPHRWLRPAIYGLLGLVWMFGFNFLLVTLSPAMESQQFLTVAFPVFVITLVMVTVSAMVVLSRATRERIERIVAGSGTYRADSPVHTVAIVLAILVTGWVLMNFVVAGGLDGVAEAFEEAPPSEVENIFFAILNVLIALLGIGLYIRRTMPQALDRLSLRMPIRADLNYGIGIGVVLLVFEFVGTSVWQSLTPPELFEMQTRASRLLFEAYRGSLSSGLLLALTAAVGEEILYRGALQPVFGLVLTSVFFTILHAQYLLTPATLIIFVIALGLGWIRQRQSTSASMLAHFIYNFLPFLLAQVGS
jgi:hypothetical protein